MLSNATWVRRPLDRFVLARLDREGLQPTAAADRYTIIRRLSLDLTGLPPAIEEVDRFVADKSPKAYENLVDRLLDSTAYGERWARVWLDLARYADSAGYAQDPPADHLAVSRLGDSGTQCQHAVRRIHRAAVGGRHVTEAD